MLSFPLTRTSVIGKTDDGIGIVGVDNIVKNGHVAAYREVHLCPLALYNHNVGCVEQTARHWGPVACRSPEELVDRSDGDIVRVAVPPLYQPDIVAAIGARGKHVFVHKPIAKDLVSAQRMVSVARSSGVTFAVFQNPRWVTAIRAARHLIDQEVISQPLFRVVLRGRGSRLTIVVPQLKNEKTRHVLHTSIQCLDAI